MSNPRRALTEAEQKIVEDALARLAEHFEIVQIFVSSEDGGVTTVGDAGCGNHLAREMLCCNFGCDLVAEFEELEEDGDGE